MPKIYGDSEDGNDEHDGLRPGYPVKTMSRINALLPNLNAGDALLLAPRETPYQGRLNMNRSGSAGNPIYIEPYGSGDSDRPILSNPIQANSAGNLVCVDVNASHVTFNGIRFQDSLYGGLVQYEAKTGLTLDDCVFTRLGMGARLKSPGFLIKNTRFIDIDRMVKDENLDTDYGGVGISFEAPTGSTVGGTVRDCEFEGCIAKSRKFKMDGGMFEFFGGINGLQIFNIRGRKTKGIAEFGAPAITDTIAGLTMYNVVAHDTYGIGFFFNDPAGGFPVSIATNGIDLYHCTFDSSDRDETFWFMDGLWGSLAGKIKIRNTIVITGAAQIFKMDDTNNANIGTMDHQDNVFWRTDSGTNIGFTLDASEVRADPLFINRVGGNYRLQAGSPAVGVAQTIAGYSGDSSGRAPNVPPDAGAHALVIASAVPNTRPQAQPISRLTDRSAYHAFNPNDGWGGVHHVNTIAERNDIPTALRRPGLICLVGDVPYILKKDLLNWRPMFASPDIALEPVIAQLTYVVSSGTSGGSGAADLQHVRPLNTIEQNFSLTDPTAKDLTLDTVSSQFTLPEGNYYLEATLIINRTNGTRGQVFNNTDSVVIGRRSFPGWAPTNADTNMMLVIPPTRIAITAPKALSIRMIADNLDGATPNFQWGRPVGAVTGGDGASEMFTFVQITKVK